MPTLTPGEAANLFNAEAGATVDAWTKVGNAGYDNGHDHPSRSTSRWHEKYWLVVRDEHGATWGIEYGIGLTEDQEDDLPWARGVQDVLNLTRLHAHTITHVDYRTTPPRQADGPATGAQVTAVDLATGQVRQATIPPGNYVLIVVSPCDLVHEQHSPNGRSVLTLHGCAPNVMGSRNIGPVVDGGSS